MKLNGDYSNEHADRSANVCHSLLPSQCRGDFAAAWSGRIWRKKESRASEIQFRNSNGCPPASRRVLLPAAAPAGATPECCRGAPRTRTTHPAGKRQFAAEACVMRSLLLLAGSPDSGATRAHEHKRQKSMAARERVEWRARGGGEPSGLPYPVPATLLLLSTSLTACVHHVLPATSLPHPNPNSTPN